MPRIQSRNREETPERQKRHQTAIGDHPPEEEASKTSKAEHAGRQGRTREYRNGQPEQLKLELEITLNVWRNISARLCCSEAYKGAG
jgi:hypothetical protein